MVMHESMMLDVRWRGRPTISQIVVGQCKQANFHVANPWFPKRTHRTMGNLVAQIYGNFSGGMSRVFSGRFLAWGYSQSSISNDGMFQDVPSKNHPCWGSPMVENPHLWGVSWNRVIPKSSISMGFARINHPFWGTPMAMETPIYPFRAWMATVHPASE